MMTHDHTTTETNMNVVTHREYGSMPFVIPAPKDKGMLELSGLTPESVSEQYSRVISRYLTGGYPGENGFQEFMGDKDKKNVDLALEARLDEWESKNKAA